MCSTTTGLLLVTCLGLLVHGLAALSPALPQGGSLSVPQRSAQSALASSMYSAGGKLVIKYSEGRNVTKQWGVKVGAHVNVNKTKDVTVMFPHRAVYWSATPQSNKTTFHWANSTEDIWGYALRMEVNNTGTMCQPVSQPSDSVLPFLIPLPLLALDSLLLLSSTNYEPCPTDPRTRCTHYLFPGYTYEAGDWSINTVWETNMWIVTETGIPTVIETVDWRTSGSHHNPSSDPTHVFYFDHFQPLKDEWTRPNEILKPDPFCLPFELKTPPKLQHPFTIMLNSTDSLLKIYYGALNRTTLQPARLREDSFPPSGNAFEASLRVGTEKFTFRSKEGMINYCAKGAYFYWPETFHDFRGYRTCTQPDTGTTVRCAEFGSFLVDPKTGIPYWDGTKKFFQYNASFTDSDAHPNPVFDIPDYCLP